MNKSRKNQVWGSGRDGRVEQRMFDPEARVFSEGAVCCLAKTEDRSSLENWGKERNLLKV